MQQQGAGPNSVSSSDGPQQQQLLQQPHDEPQHEWPQPQPQPQPHDDWQQQDGSQQHDGWQQQLGSQQPQWSQPQPQPQPQPQHGVAKKTTFLSYISDEELARLYGRARVFVFLSEYEGFGLTPLEALAAGVPAVVLDTPVAREVYKNAAVFVRPDDIDGAANAIHGLLVEPGTAAPLLAHAGAVLREYSWDDAAARTLTEIERAAR